VLVVEETIASGGAILHRGFVEEGELRPAEPADCAVDYEWRAGSTRNHTGTHLLHAALRAVLGGHVRQQGSLVTPERLRFDFTHLEQTPRELLAEVEALVNDKVRRNLEVSWRRTGFRQAVAAGALAFFGDKYGDEVRVVEISDVAGNFSAELCGGTHVAATGEIGFVHVLRESAVAAGTRRIEALTGRGAESYLREQQALLHRVADRLSTTPAELESKVESIELELLRLKAQSDQLRRLQAAALADGLAEDAVEVAGSHLVAGRADVLDADVLRDIADRLRSRLRSCLVIIGGVIDGRPAFLVAATRDLVDRGVNSGALIREVAKVAGGGGGGRPDLAQAGARDLALVDAALNTGRGIGEATLRNL
jgi:alanyl-tRNA synthetase